jgi:hypothetical protein
VLSPLGEVLGPVAAPVTGVLVPVAGGVLVPVGESAGPLLPGTPGVNVQAPLTPGPGGTTTRAGQGGAVVPGTSATDVAVGAPVSGSATPIEAEGAVAAPAGRPSRAPSERRLPASPAVPAGMGSVNGSGAAAALGLLAVLATIALLHALGRGLRVGLEHTSGASLALCPAALPG